MLIDMQRTGVDLPHAATCRMRTCTTAVAPEAGPEQKPRGKRWFARCRRRRADTVEGGNLNRGAAPMQEQLSGHPQQGWWPARLAPAAAHPPGPATIGHQYSGWRSARCWNRAVESRIYCLMARAWPAGRPLQIARRPAAWRSSLRQRDRRWHQRCRSGADVQRCGHLRRGSWAAWEPASVNATMSGCVVV